MRKCLFVLMISFTAYHAQGAGPACPEILRLAGKSAALPASFADECALYSRFQAALLEMKNAGYPAPLRAANVIAPRFINKIDWEKALAAESAPNPKTVYDPAPLTWENWEKASRAAQLNTIAPSGEPRPKPITESHLLALFQLAMAHSRYGSGWRTTTVEIGRAWEESTALPVEQTEQINKSSFGASGPLVVWHTTQCFATRTPEFKKLYLADMGTYSRITHWPDVADSTFTDAKGLRRRCGYLQYSDSKLVPAHVKTWLANLNSPINDWLTKKKPYDPIRLAARAQRWLVAIHPFQGGNGRISRLIMDEILQSAGLPPPLLEEMDDDLGSSEDEWAKQVGAGLARTLDAMTACAKAPTSRGCARSAE